MGRKRKYLFLIGLLFSFIGIGACNVGMKETKAAESTSVTESGFEQYKGGKWKSIKTIDKNTTISYKVKGLKASKTYKFRIRAYKKDGKCKLYSATYTTKMVKTL